MSLQGKTSLAECKPTNLIGYLQNLLAGSKTTFNVGHSWDFVNSLDGVT
jgi:hypothetical protein